MKLHSPLARRRGLTLTEALVAMFIAAIGMISLLTLFPLGALQMAQAIKDARCTEAAIQAEAAMRSHWKNETDAGLRGAVNAGSVVFVDPIGLASNMDTMVIEDATLPRQTLSTVTGALGQRVRFCSILDDMTFTDGGVPVGVNTNTVGNPGAVERAGRYNWLAVLQLPGTGAVNAANCTILVFDGRSPGYSPQNAEIGYPGWDEATPAATTPPTPTATAPPAATTAGLPVPRYSLITPNNTSIQLKFPTGTPAVPVLAKGRWIALYTRGNRLLTFHRVVSVTETSETRSLPAATEMTIYTLELQTPVHPNHTGGLGTTAIVFAGLAEVFDRGIILGP